MEIQSMNSYPMEFGKNKNACFVNGRSEDTPAKRPHVYGKNRKVTIGSNANVMTTYFSSEKSTLQFSNKDGDTFSLSVEHIEYQRTMVSLGDSPDASKWQEIVENIKNEYRQLKENILRELLGNSSGKSSEINQNDDSIEIKGLPEYWNAENTSQRIVDFAISFYDIAENSGKEYYEMMRGAIQDGFNQAFNIMGELPGEIRSLAQNTYDLAIEKLDNWANELGIDIEKETPASA